MAAPILFISRWRIRKGQRAALETLFAEVVDVIASTKPGTALYAAFIDDSGTEARIIHAFPDADAMSAHFEGSEERSGSVQEMIELLGFEVYGAAPQGTIGQLRREASGVPEAQLTLLPVNVGGYLRTPG